MMRRPSKGRPSTVRLRFISPEDVLAPPGLFRRIRNTIELLLLGGLFYICGAEGVPGLGNRKERGIELDERRVNRAVVGVAGVTYHVSRGHLRRLGVVESEESPFPWKTRHVLDVDFDSH